MKRKLVSILMGAAMAVTTIAAPTAIFADDIDIADIAVETEADDVADVEVEDEAEPAEEVTAEDDFSAEADDAEGLFTDAEDSDIAVQSDDTVVSARVIASAVKADNDYICMPDHITVTSDTADKLGYKDEVKQSEAVSALDVLVALHKTQYTMTSATAENYLKLWYQKDKGAWIDKMFGVETTAVSFAVNGLAPHTDKMYVDPTTKKETNDYVGKMVNEAAVENGDVVDFFFYQDTQSYSDMYAYFADDNGNFLKSLTVTPGETYTLNVKAYAYKMYSLSIPSWRQYFIENAPDNIMLTDKGQNYYFLTENGRVTIDVPSDATGSITLYGMMYDSAAYRYIMPHIELTVAN